MWDGSKTNGAHENKINFITSYMNMNIIILTTSMKRATQKVLGTKKHFPNYFILF
jgi:hypothetical protein